LAACARARCSALVLAGLARLLGEGRRRFSLRRYVLEKRSDRSVGLASLGPRQGGVGDIADQHVLEPELLLPPESRDRLAPDEVSSLQRIEQHGQPVLELAETRQRAAPEDLADHRGVEQQRPCRAAKGGEASGDASADARGKPLRVWRRSLRQ